jgi:hypothetical protein
MANRQTFRVGESIRVNQLYFGVRRQSGSGDGAWVRAELVVDKRTFRAGESGVATAFCHRSPYLTFALRLRLCAFVSWLFKNPGIFPRHWLLLVSLGVYSWFF